MKKRQIILIAVASAVLLSLAVACVTAGTWTSSTPLFTLRMEQASSEMNFLPRSAAGFTYTTGNGYTLGYCASGCKGAVPLAPVTYNTCQEETCDEPTCYNTCPGVCYTTTPTCQSCGCCGTGGGGGGDPGTSEVDPFCCKDTSGPG